MTMNLDHDELHRLLALLGDSDIQEFRLEGKDFSLEVKRNIVSPTSNAVSPVISNDEINQAASQLISEPSTGAPSIPGNPPPVVPASRADLVEITSPMVGTFYRAPAPGEAVFAEVGSRIASGQTVCIIEAMKLMNELESEVSGEVVEILVENGTPVEFGQVLMKVKP